MGKERHGIGPVPLAAFCEIENAALLPAGLGLLPALFGEHRGLHDRLADTRVVKA